MATTTKSPRLTIRDLGYTPGELPAGKKNSILDVPGVTIGQAIQQDGNTVRAGVTVLFPRGKDTLSVPCYAGFHTLNGNGEVTGHRQVRDWGFVNTPIAFTNSTSLGLVYHAIWQFILAHHRSHSTPLSQMGRDYGTPVVGETADWWLNDSFHSTLGLETINQALEVAASGEQTEVLEGQNGGGAGMTCHFFTGGTGTSSRVVDGERDGETVEGLYTVGVLCQSNYGYLKDLRIGGVPVGRLLQKEKETEGEQEGKGGGKVEDGSIVVIIITDAPMAPHQLTRLAARATLGLSQVGGHGVGRNHSGDIFLALSTANIPDEQLMGSRPNHTQPRVETQRLSVMKNESVDGVFRAASEAVEEAILNSLVGGRGGRTTFEGGRVEGFPVERVRKLLGRYLVDI